MEFLGDSVLQFVVSVYLFKHFPEHHEGHLTVVIDLASLEKPGTRGAGVRLWESSLDILGLRLPLTAPLILFSVDAAELCFGRALHNFCLFNYMHPSSLPSSPLTLPPPKKEYHEFLRAHPDHSLVESLKPHWKCQIATPNDAVGKL